jgi:hypothetical protein
MDKFWESLVGKTVRFTKDVEIAESNYDEGMLSTITKIVELQGEVVEIFFDHTAFVEENKKFAKANYYDSFGVPCQTWFEQKNYSDKTVEYFDADYVEYPHLLLSLEMKK